MWEVTREGRVHGVQGQHCQWLCLQAQVSFLLRMVTSPGPRGHALQPRKPNCCSLLDPLSTGGLGRSGEHLRGPATLDLQVQTWEVRPPGAWESQKWRSEQEDQGRPSDGCDQRTLLGGCYRPWCVGRARGLGCPPGWVQLPCLPSPPLLMEEPWLLAKGPVLSGPSGREGELGAECWAGPAPRRASPAALLIQPSHIWRPCRAHCSYRNTPACPSLLMGAGHGPSRICTAPHPGPACPARPAQVLVWRRLPQGAS